MLLQTFIHKKVSVTILMLLTGFTLLAQDAPVVKTVSSGNNLLATLLIVSGIILLLVIYGLGQVLIVLTRQLLDKNKAALQIATASLVMILSLLSGNLLAQDAVTEGLVKSVPNYGGLSVTTFYCLVGVISTEVVAILFLFFSIRRIYTELVPAKAVAVVKASKLVALWVNLNKKLTKAIPIEQEADALLDHNYDGIQELNNALPPWWKYGFILTIGFAIIYIINFHVWGNGKNPTEEYQAEMVAAHIQKDEYEAKNKDKIDESNVPMANSAGVNNGKDRFMANCIACHGAMGEGGAGPNLTDNYWIHKGSLNDIYNTIKKGYPDKGMQSWAIKFNPKEMSELASYVTTLKGTNPPGGKAPQGELSASTTDTDSSKIIKPGNLVTIK